MTVQSYWFAFLKYILDIVYFSNLGLSEINCHVIVLLSLKRSAQEHSSQCRFAAGQYQIPVQ